MLMRQRTDHDPLGQGEIVSHKSLIDSRGDLVSFDVLSTIEIATITPGLAIPLIFIQSSLGPLSVGWEAQNI
jgi:hypothetical protein